MQLHSELSELVAVMSSERGLHDTGSDAVQLLSELAALALPGTGSLKVGNTLDNNRESRVEVLLS